MTLLNDNSENAMSLPSNTALKSLLLSSLLLALVPATHSNAAVKGQSSVPFQGTRGFDFWGTRGTEQFIEIDSKGYTTIKSYDVYGDDSATIHYQGKYKNPIVTNDGEIYKISKGKIYLVDSNGRTKRGCNEYRTGQIEPCVSNLHK